MYALAVLIQKMLRGSLGLCDGPVFIQGALLAAASLAPP